MEPLFSIIIPHFDIPDLLMRCLHSIPVSSDIQIIVVDDNSPGAAEYIHKYPELSRPYLEFIRTTKGGGAGYARNVGLEHAMGKWLLFADADDFFAHDMYDIITQHIESDADIVYFRIKSVYNDNLQKESQKCNSINKLLDTYYKTGDEKPIRSTHGVPWGKMIKRELIEKYDIRFEATMYTNDRFFSINSGIYATKICVANEMLYYYVDRPHSLTDNFNKKPNELRIRAEVNFQVEKNLLKHGMCVNRHFKFFMWAMLKQDHQLFRYYFNRLNEIYPSKLSALIDIAKGHNIIYQIIYYLYIPWILISIPFYQSKTIVYK